ncbi:CS1-pili formation C-terminal domain-containing protein [Vibrio hepatarius]|uniref:CS1-pili formation C-terminal domain-containing protein n=1 Tax=Vibrio hepatarius TaxID=171383 RepID=UPI003736EF42
MKYIIFIPVCAILFVLWVSNVNAMYVPEDFQHFYKYERKNILFELPNQKKIKLKVDANFQHIKNFVDIELTSKGLSESGIKKKYVNEIIENISSISEYLVKQDLYVEYLPDYNTAIVHVPSEYMDGDYHKLEFTKQEPSSTALIVNNRLFTTSASDNFIGSLSTQSTLGLGRGHFELDTTISNDFNLEIDKYSYTYDFQGASITAGYRNQASPTVNNSTSTFDYAYDVHGSYLSYYSNDNLLLKRKDEVGKIYFDMKGAGFVTLVRDGKVIYNSSVLRGQNFIPYSQLPSGNYNAILIVKPDGYQEERYKKIINNTPWYTSKRGYDYSFSFKKSNFESGINQYSSDYVDTSFVGSFLDRRLLINAQTQFDKETVHLGFGYNFKGNSLNTSGFIGAFADGTLININAGILGLSLDYRKLTLSNGSLPSNLTAVRYGDNSYSQTGFSYTSGFIYGNLGVNLSIYKEDITSEQENPLEILSLSLNHNSKIFTNTDLTLGYSYNKDVVDGNSKIDDHSVSMNISFPLGKTLNYNTGFDYFQDSNTRFTNTVSYEAGSYRLGNVDLYASPYISHYVDLYSSDVTFGGNVAFGNDSFKGNAFGYITEKEAGALSSNLEFTTVLSKNGIHFTNEKSDSYLILNNDTTIQTEELSDIGLVTLNSDRGYIRRHKIYGNNTIVNLKSYSDYDIAIDTQVSGFIGAKDSIPHDHMFSYPGTVKVINNKVTEIVDFLTYFSDFNNEPLNNVDCLGKACVSISNVGEGIFNISVVKGERFKIVSNNQVCLLKDFGLDNMNGTSYCFPTIKEKDNGAQLVMQGLGKEGDLIYYLGIREKPVPRNIKEDILESGIRIDDYKFGDNIHLFAHVLSEDDVNSIELVSLKSLVARIQEYVVDSKHVQNYTVIR